MLCTELPTLENGKAVAEEAPGGQQGVALTYTIRPDATWGDGTPITTRDVQFTWEVGRHPKSGVGNAEMYRRFWQLDVIDDKTFTVHDEKLGFNYNAINDFRLLPEHLERPVFEADPDDLPQPDPVRHRAHQPGPRLRPLPHRADRARQPDPARAQPDLVGRAAGLRPHRDQGDREHHGTRGQPALRRGRHGRGLASACRSTRRWPSSAAMATGSRSSTSRAWSTSIWTSCSTTRSLADVRVRQALLYGLDRAGDQRAAVRRPPAGGRHHGPSAGLGPYRRGPTLRLRPGQGRGPARRGRLAARCRTACGATRPASPCASS